MIPRANEAFWKQLDSLDFLTDDQRQSWRAFANQPNQTWSDLVRKISEESLLRPAHLNQLSSDSGQRVIWGNYLLSRPQFHPLGWPTYEAVHAKLHRDFRLIFLPTDGTGSQTMQRARKVAAISSNEIVKVIDIEVFGDVVIAITQLPQGQRLTQWVQQPGPESHWRNCIQTLAAELEMIHQSGVNQGGIDPLSILVDTHTGRCRLDFLISSPQLAISNSVPMELDDREQRSLVGFRTLRDQVLGEPAGGSWSAALSLSDAMEHDWRTFGVLLQYLVQHVGQQDSSFWDSVARLGSALVAGTENGARLWQNWLHTAGAPAAEEQKEETGEVGIATLPVDVFTQATPGEESPTFNLSDAEVATQSKTIAKPSVVQRRESRKVKVDQQRRVMLLAMLAPLPLVVFGGLAYYLLFVQPDQRPSQLSYQGEIEALPKANLKASEPQGEKNHQEQAGENSSAADNTSDGHEASDPKPSMEEPSTEEPSTDKNNTEASGNETATQPSGGREESPASDSLSPDLPAPKLNTSAQANTAGSDQANNSAPAIEPAMPPEAAETTTAETTTAETTTDTADKEMGVLTFEGLVSIADIPAAWQEQKENLKGEDSAVVLDLGPISTGTATHATIQWEGPVDADIKTIAVDSVQDDRRTWHLLAGQQIDPVAILRARADGRLELAMPKSSESSWSQLAQGKLVFSYEPDPTMGHQIVLFQPRTAPKIPFQRGVIRAVSWETPELARQEGWIQLSMSGHPMTRLDEDAAASLNLRKGEQFYYIGETPELGTLGLVGRFTPGRTSRFQGQLMVLTTKGPLRYDEPDKAAAISEALNTENAQIDALVAQIESVRAKSGEGDAKKRRLDELKAQKRQNDEFREKLEFLLEKGEGIYAGGVDFQIRMGTEPEGMVLLESGQNEAEFEESNQ